MLNSINAVYKAAAFALVAVGLLALYAVYYLYDSSSVGASKTFTVQGKGEAMAVPNKASVSANFVSEGKTQQEASDALAKSLTAANAEFAKIGIKKEDIKTESVSLNPKYESCNVSADSRIAPPCNFNNPKIIGYTASQNIKLSFKIENGDKASLEKTLGQLSSLGARDVNGPNFEADNKEAIKIAREMATKEAREKGEAIAKALGMRLGKVVSYSESTGGGGYPYPMMMKASFDSASVKESAPVPVSLGEDKVVLNVDVTYEMK